MRPHRVDTPPDREALHWLIALQEAPGDTVLRDHFRAWLQASPTHADAWRDLNRVDDLIGQALSAAEAAPPPRRARPVTAMAMTAFALAACLLLAFVPMLQAGLQADHRTTTAEMRRIVLADGSRVMLAPDSAITVSLGEGKRAVALLRGEAFFEVQRDPARPFTVVAGDSSVRVVGTAFNVRRLAAGAEVAVAQGAVQVSRADTHVDLRPGDSIDTSQGQHGIRSTLPTELVAPWRHGQLVVKDRSVADVVDTLRRYHDGVIMLHGSTLAERRITGIFTPDDAEAALTALVAPLGGSVIRVTPWFVLVIG